MADRVIDGILGLDFIKKNNDCLIDLPNSSMRIKGKKVKLSFEGNVGCCRITLTENVSIPPNKEVITMGNVVPPVFEKIPSVGIIETSDRLL